MWIIRKHFGNQNTLFSHHQGFTEPSLVKVSPNIYFILNASSVDESGSRVTKMSELNSCYGRNLKSLLRNKRKLLWDGYELVQGHIEFDVLEGIKVDALKKPCNLGVNTFGDVMETKRGSLGTKPAPSEAAAVTRKGRLRPRLSRSPCFAERLPAANTRGRKPGSGKARGPHLGPWSGGGALRVSRDPADAPAPPRSLPGSPRPPARLNRRGPRNLTFDPSSEREENARSRSKRQGRGVGEPALRPAERARGRAGRVVRVGRGRVDTWFRNHHRGEQAVFMGFQ
ncbi:uncharacterized protein [Oryctolagus cuniculus]|uniref:uncharacterized protein n=1 Tax=Oryctolagus cuniculus TaxID=9986 RepID=UPI003879E95D